MKLLGWPDLRARGISYSKVTIWRLIKKGAFPKPIKMNSSAANTANFWSEQEIDDWLICRLESRNGMAA